jgi:hypothetical protein
MDSDKEQTLMNDETSMNPTVRGIMIDCNEEKANADDSIRFNDDGLANVIDSRDLQCAKQLKHKIST